jgi:hypothetical protein
MALDFKAEQVLAATTVNSQSATVSTEAAKSTCSSPSEARTGRKSGNRRHQLCCSDASMRLCCKNKI